METVVNTQNDGRVYKECLNDIFEANISIRFTLVYKDVSVKALLNFHLNIANPLMTNHVFFNLCI